MSSVEVEAEGGGVGAAGGWAVPMPAAGAVLVLDEGEFVLGFGFVDEGGGVGLEARSAGEGEVVAGAAGVIGGAGDELLGSLAGPGDRVGREMADGEVVDSNPMFLLGGAVIEVEARLGVAFDGEIAFADVAPVAPGSGAELATDAVLIGLEAEFDPVIVERDDGDGSGAVAFLASHDDGEPAGDEFLAEFDHVAGVVVPDEVGLFPLGGGAVTDGDADLDGLLGGGRDGVDEDVFGVIGAAPHVAGLDADFESGGAGAPGGGVFAFEGPAGGEGAEEALCEDEVAGEGRGGGKEEAEGEEGRHGATGRAGVSGHRGSIGGGPGLSAQDSVWGLGGGRCGGWFGFGEASF